MADFLDAAREAYASGGVQAPPLVVPQDAGVPGPSGGSTMASSAASVQTQPGPAPIDYSTPYAMDRATGKLYAGGHEIPTDIAMWKQVAAADPSTVPAMSRSVIQQHNLEPLSHDELINAIAQIDKNANAPVMSNIGNALGEGIKAIPAGVAKIGAAIGQSKAGDLYRSAMRGVGLDGLADFNQQAAQSLQDVGNQYSQSIHDQETARRAGLTLQEQAGNDAGFTSHPGTYIAAKGSTMLGGAAPMVASFALNPALGIGVAGAQSADTMSTMAQDAIREKLSNKTPEEMAQIPEYVQLRQQGMDDATAKEHLVAAGGQTAALAGGGLGMATAPFFGRLGMGVLRQGTVAGLVPQAAAGNFVARALATGLEGAALSQATTIPSQMAAEHTAGVGSANPWNYVNGEEIAQQVAGMGLMGGFAKHDPVAVARSSDFGAAADGIGGAKPDVATAPDFTTSPGAAPAKTPYDFPEPAPRAPVAPDFTTSPGVADPNAPVAPRPQAPVAPDFETVPGAAPPPEPQAPLPTPQAPDWSLDPKARQGTLGQRRDLQAQELDARNLQSQQNPAALPPQGPTEGQTTRVSSAQQSLDMINNLIDSGQFNKRTKAGKATLATLAAEKSRLEAEVATADNAVLGEQMGGAREARPPIDTGVSKYIDPTSGQHELIPAAADPRLTGELPPPGAKPGDSVEPPPIPNPEPMSPEEAASRLATQRARRPDRQAPQPDLFPRELRQGLQERVQAGQPVREQAIAQSEQGVSPSTPEPAADLQAQADALGKTSDAMFVAKGNEAQMPKVKRGVRKVVRDEGTLFTTNAEKAKAYREAPNVDDALLARMQDLPETKAAAMRSPNPSVVAAEDARGNVVKEAVSTPGGPNDAVVAAATPTGGRTVRRDALTAQARRAKRLSGEEVLNPAAAASRSLKAKADAVAARVESEASTRSRSEQLKDSAAEKRAQGKKKVDAPQAVSREELSPKGETADKARVRDAEQTLIKDLQANHPHLLDEADLQPAVERTGAGRERESVLNRVPITHNEFGTLADRTHASAKSEAAAIDAGTWTARDSAVRRILDAMGVRPENERQLRGAIKDMATLDPAQLRKFMARGASRLADSTMAKSIVRGADVIRATQPKNIEQLREANRDVHDPYDGARIAKMATGARPEDGSPEVNEAASSRRVRVYGDKVPGNVSDVIGAWSKIIEKNAPDAMPDKIHVMSPEQALSRYRSQLEGLIDGADDGFTGTLTGPDGKPEKVIALDWGKFGKDHPASMEVLAHEMGHIISDQIHDSLPKADKDAVNQAFKDWLDASGRQTPNEQMASRLPPALADILRKSGDAPDRAYSAEWREWIADETAKWLLTERAPRTAVERFFAKIAEAMKALYANVAGRGSPTEAVRQMMNNWVEQGRALRENDAAARAADMDYGRETAEPATPGETARAKIDTRAVQRRMEEAVNGAMTLGKGVGDAIKGDPANLKRSLNNAIGSIAEGKAGDFVRKASFAVSSMNDMVGRYGGKAHGDFGDGLTRWDHAMRLAEKYSKDAQQQGQIAMEKSQRLSTPVRNALEDLMYKSTVYGIHPDEGFAKGRNKHLADEDPAVTDANQRRYGEVVAAWDKLKGIAGNPQQVYKDLREAMATLHKDTYEARRDALDALPLDAAAKEEGHRMLNAAEERMVEGPYFPLVREGSYITTAMMPAKFLGEFDTAAEAKAIARREKATNPHAEVQVAKTPDGTYAVHSGEKAVYFHDSLKDAKNARANIEAEMREAWKHQQVDIDQVDGPTISQPMTTVDFYRKAEVPTSGSFMTELNRLHEGQHIDPQAYKQMAEMYIESLPETSPRKAFLRRENIRGANRRMIAGYSRRLLGAAHAYGQTKIATERNDAWAKMYKNRAAKPEYGQVMSDIFNRQKILAERMTHNPLNTFASTVQDGSSFMSLAFSPGFALQQAIQPIVLSAPVLAARMNREGKAVGYGKTLDALKQAYSDAPGFFLKRGGQQWAHEFKRVLGTYGGDGKTLQESAKSLIEKFGKTDDEREMLQYLNDRGTLDFSFLNAVTDATSQSAAGAKAKAIMRLSMAFPQQIEAMNRTVTGLAAYRLAMAERGMDHADAVREANAVVSQTHGDYSRYNRPSVFNRPLAGMALQFKMYTQFMYSLLASNVAHAMNPNLSKAERTQAVRTLGYVMGSHAVIGGAIGLGPIAAAAKLGLGAVMYGLAGAGMIDKKKRDQTMGDYIAAETEHYGDEVFGTGNGRALRQVGTYGLLGLLGTNMANKIAIPDITDTRFTGKPLSERAVPGDAIDRFALSALGSVYSNGKRLANGTGDLLSGDVKGAAQQILPAAPRALLNAATESQNGVVTGTGKVVKGHDEISPYDTFLRAVGLNSADTDMRYDDRGRVSAAMDRIQTSRQDLIADYRNAKTPEEKADVMAQVAAFNRGRAKELQLSTASLARAVSPAGQRPNKEETQVRRAIGVTGK